MQLGPIHFIWDISIGSLLILGGVLWAAVKYVSKLDRLYNAFYNGKHLGPECFFARFTLLEEKINQVWEKVFRDGSDQTQAGS